MLLPSALSRHLGREVWTVVLLFESCCCFLLYKSCYATTSEVIIKTSCTCRPNRQALC